MNRELIFNDGIIDGDAVREVKSVFPELKNSFRQRKTYDEYYYEKTEVIISLDRIQKLTDLFFNVSINEREILLEN
jgi:hypothetical protein